MVPRLETRVFDELYRYSYSTPGPSWRSWDGLGGFGKALGRLQEGSGKASGGSGRLWEAPGGSGELQGVARGCRDVCRGDVAAGFVQKHIESGSRYVHRYIEN